MQFITIDVEQREERGSRAMRRLRDADRIPAVLYGLGRRNLPLTLPEDGLRSFLRSGSHLVELKMGDETRDAILREVQVDPLNDRVLHVDFQRVEKGVPVDDEVPIVFKGTPKGVSEGGIFQTLLDKLAVRARPRDLPREILLDVSGLGVGDEIRVRDVDLGEGVEATEDGDRLIANCAALKEQALPEPGEEGAEAATAEPTLASDEAEEEAATES